jgi:hypothetical protein
MALGQEQQEAMAMGQRQRSIVPIAMIDGSCGCGAWGAGVDDVYSVCFIRNVSECPNGGPIKGVEYLVDYID